ncbi:MAG: S9 family peptidase [Crocinitomicaceae bacterium]|nr:S9 family peptidase [Crocinitomicaceae bacterium]
MVKYILFIGAFIVSTGLSAQKKELTLKDAVMNQYRTFGPDRINGFEWIPNTDCYSFVSRNYQILYKSSVAETKDKEWYTIQRVNEILGAELTSFYGLSWKNENEFVLSDGTKYYEFNTVTNKGKQIYSLDEAAENALFHDGSQNIAFTKGNNVYVNTASGLKLIVTDNSDKNIVSGQAIARSEFGITGGLFWSNDGQHLAFYQKNESNVHEYPLVDINQTPAELMPIKYPMAGQKSENPKVGIYHLATKQTVFISPKGAADDYLTNITFTPDNNYVVIAEVNRDQNHMWLNVYETKSGAFVRTLFEETNDKWVEPEHPAFFPNKKSNNFIWISERDGFNNLYYYDFSGKLIKQLTKNKFVVKDIIDAKKDGKLIYFTATGENATNTLVYSVDLTGKQALVTRNEGTHEFRLCTNGAYYMDAFSNHTTAFSSMIWTSNGKMAKGLVTSKDKLGDYKIGTSEISTLTGKDGSILYTRLIKPSNFDPTKKYPVLVYVYGGPHAQMVTNSWLDGANLWMFWMAEQGYLVYTLDGRGSGERGFAFESQIHRQLGNVEMEDQLSGVDYLKSLPYVDASRLAVHGWSFGGFMTTSLMLRHPEVFQVGVAGGPVTDWKYYEIMYGERYMDRPEQNLKGYEQASLMTHAGNLKGDLLLIHGTVDDVVVMQHNFALVKKFVDLGIQMDFFPYPMHKHNVTGKDRVHLIEKVLTYVLENNK